TSCAEPIDGGPLGSGASGLHGGAGFSHLLELRSRFAALWVPRALAGCPPPQPEPGEVAGGRAGPREFLPPARSFHGGRQRRAASTRAGRAGNSSCSFASKEDFRRAP